jgi:MFS family permease
MPALVVVAAVVAVVSSLGAPLVPGIAAADGVSLSTAQWVLTAALMTGALATPAMGRLADGPYKSRVIVVALATVLVGCVLAALSRGFTVLVIARGMQGVGLGLLPVTMAIARSHLPAERAGRAIATLSVTAAAAAGLGYPITGLIAQAFDFHAAFWFGAITVAGALVMALATLPRRSEAPSRPFDLAGMVALGAVIVAVSVVLSEGGGWGWTSPVTLGIMGASVAVAGLWVAHELRSADPLIDVRQVTNRSVLTADVSGFLIAVAMYLFIPIIVEFVQIPGVNGYGFGASVSVAGLVLVPLSAGSFVASRGLSLYERHFGTRTMIPVGSLVFAVGALFFALGNGELWAAFVASGLAGIGIGFTFAAMPGFIVRSVPPHETGSATGFYQVLRSIGLSVGSALAAAILTGFTRAGHAYPTIGGFRTALGAASGLCLVTAVVSYVLPGRSVPGPASGRPGSQELAEEEGELGATGLMLTGEEMAPRGTEATP